METQKTAKKIQKEGRENTENNLFFKQWKRLFIVLKKIVFDNIKNTKNKNTPFPKHVFCVFCFQEQKTVIENNNQTRPKALNMPHVQFKLFLQKTILKKIFSYLILLKNTINKRVYYMLALNLYRVLHIAPSSLKLSNVPFIFLKLHAICIFWITMLYFFYGMAYALFVIKGKMIIFLIRKKESFHFKTPKP